MDDKHMNGNRPRPQSHGADLARIGADSFTRESLALGRILRWLLIDASQLRFQFASDLPPALPPAPTADQDLFDALTSLAHAQMNLMRDVKELKTQLVRSALPNPPGLDGTSVVERLDRIERGLGHLEPVLEENEKLRQRDFQFGVLGPLVNELIETIDGLEKDLALVTAVRAKTTRETKLCSEFAKLVTIRRDELLTLLARRSIEPFSTPVLSPFLPGRHKPIASKPAGTAADRGLIAGHVRPGYWRSTDGWVVRPQWVNVFSDMPEHSNERKNSK